MIENKDRLKMIEQLVAM